MRRDAIPANTTTMPGAGPRRAIARVRTPAGEARPVSAVGDHLAQLRTALTGGADAAATLGAALIRGESPAAVARGSGLTVVEHYVVVAVSIADLPARLGAGATAQRRERVLRELRVQCGEEALVLAGAHGGTILIPIGPEQDESACPDFPATLARVAGAPVAAVIAATDTAQLPRATTLVHELLDLVHRLGYPPCLYRFGDLSLEYQLTLPGDAQDHLLTLLTPILGCPDLLQTLRHHIDNNFHRRATARVMGIHCNTVDYRLKRIKDLTGLDPMSPSGSWRLQSAMLVHTFRTADPEHTCAGPVRHVPPPRG